MTLGYHYCKFREFQRSFLMTIMNIKTITAIRITLRIIYSMIIDSG